MSLTRTDWAVALTLAAYIIAGALAPLLPGFAR